MDPKIAAAALRAAIGFAGELANLVELGARDSGVTLPPGSIRLSGIPRALQERVDAMQAFVNAVREE